MTVLAVCVCVCVCVCARARACVCVREREKDGANFKRPFNDDGYNRTQHILSKHSTRYLHTHIYIYIYIYIYTHTHTYMLKLAHGQLKNRNKRGFKNQREIKLANITARRSMVPFVHTVSFYHFYYCY